MSELGFSDLYGSDPWEPWTPAEGFYEEELWQFETALDERVCPICAALDGNLYTIEDVLENFPEAWQTDDETIQANIHDSCRCQFFLVEAYWEE